MKKLIILILCMLASSQTEAQTTNFYTTVTNMWNQGQKTEVLAIGQERLNINSNDMAGLIIKLEYQEEFLLLEGLSNLLIRASMIGASITNANFYACFPDFNEGTQWSLEFLSTYSPDSTELAIERAKGLISNKPFSYSKELDALQKDGLCEPLTP